MFWRTINLVDKNIMPITNCQELFVIVGSNVGEHEVVVFEENVLS